MLICSPGGHGSTVIIRSSRKPGTVRNSTRELALRARGRGGGHTGRNIAENLQYFLIQVIFFN